MELKLGNGNGGSVTAARMKVVVRKQEVKQLMELVMRMNGRKAAENNNGHHTQTTTQSWVEDRLILLWRRKFATSGATMVRDFTARRRAWRPVLQSIPEEQLCLLTVNY